MAERKFKIGDHVISPEYDRSERPANQIGNGVVIEISDGDASESRAASESGWLVDVKSSKGWTITLDQNWLEHG